MDCIELDIEVVVADEAFDIHPPHPAVDYIDVDTYFASHRAHVDAWLRTQPDDMPF